MKGEKHMIILLLLSLGIIIAWSVYVRKMIREKPPKKDAAHHTPKKKYKREEITDDDYADMIAAYRNEQADDKYGWQEDLDHPWRF